ncbi:hypothetical protein QOZ51_30215, partial [Pseudomonas aeruginosa]|uniref:hypothetical protein n=1 Tax=Pseudomonas aeruginosa TaxID=287 RepID=UPI003459F684
LFADPRLHELLCGGDFDSFEVAIMSAVYNDAKLKRELAEGKSFHALLGSKLFGVTYDKIMEDKAKEKDDPTKIGWYDVSKSCVF